MSKWLAGFGVVTAIIAIILAVTVGYTRIEPKEEGVKINLTGNDKGDLETLYTGRHFFPRYTTDIEKFPLYKMNLAWTADEQEGSENNESITFQNADSMKFNCDIGISFSVIKGMGKVLYAEYNKGLDEIADIDMRNSVRSAFVRHGAIRDVEGVFGKGLPKFLDNINKDVKTIWAERGLMIHEVYLIGAMRPDPKVVAAINAKVEATQNAMAAQNKIAQAAAERKQQQERTDAAAYDILKKAEAEAKAIEMVQNQLRAGGQVYVDYLRAQRWDGKLPVNTGGYIPMMNMRVAAE